MNKIKIEKMNREKYIDSIFNGSGEYAEKFQKYLSDAWENIYNTVLSAGSVAYYEEYGLHDSVWVHALHRSPRHEGLQLSYYEKTADGRIIPTSHRDYNTFLDMVKDNLKDGCVVMIA